MGPSKNKHNVKTTTTTLTSTSSSQGGRSHLKKSSRSSSSSKCNPKKVKNCIRIFLAHLFSHVGLCILIVAYACAGAFLFEHLEADKELEIRQQTNATWNQNITQIRKDCVGELWNITIKFNVLYELNWTRAVEKELKKFEDEVAKTAATEGYVENDTDPKKKWSFSGALLYAVSIITTIGYGDRVPKTEKGKVLTMFYAVVGVPLMLLWLSNIGSLMANTFKFVYSHARCSSSSSSSTSSSKKPSRPVHNNKCASSSTFQPPASTQVKYSVASKTCETSLIQHNHHQPSLPLKNLDAAAQRVLFECAEYNMNMCEDVRSRQILQQLYCPQQDLIMGQDVSVGVDNGIEEESSDAESVIDISGQGQGVLLNERRNSPMSMLSSSLVQGSVVGVSGGMCSDHERNQDRDRGMSCGSRNNHGTPSKVPLLHHGESGPDLVDMGLDDEMDHDHDNDIDCPTPPSSSCTSTKVTNSNSNSNKDRVPISLVLAFVVAYLMVGAVCFNTWEDWTLLDSAYFCFITLSTIGLGDLTPGKSLDTEQSHGQLIFCSLFLVCGLAVISMSLNLMQQQVIDSAKRLAFRLGIIRKEDEA